MKKTAYKVALTLAIGTFLLGSFLVVTLIWLPEAANEFYAKLLLTSGVVFVASTIACVFLRESQHDDKLRKDRLIN